MGAKRRRDKTPSQRQLRIGEELRHGIARILERAHFRDPDLAGVPITVTEVRASPDLKNATVFVTPLGGANVNAVISALRRAAPYFRGQIGREVRMRFVPTLTFEPDMSFEYVSHIESLLRQPTVARDIGAHDIGEDLTAGKESGTVEPGEAASGGTKRHGA
jgi:ribosome-binding factor A